MADQIRHTYRTKDRIFEERVYVTNVWIKHGDPDYTPEDETRPRKIITGREFSINGRQVREEKFKRELQPIAGLVKEGE